VWLRSQRLQADLQDTMLPLGICVTAAQAYGGTILATRPFWPPELQWLDAAAAGAAIDSMLDARERDPVAFAKWAAEPIGTDGRFLPKEILGTAGGVTIRLADYLTDDAIPRWRRVAGFFRDGGVLRLLPRRHSNVYGWEWTLAYGPSPRAGYVPAPEELEPQPAALPAALASIPRSITFTPMKGAHFALIDAERGLAPEPPLGPTKRVRMHRHFGGRAVQVNGQDTHLAPGEVAELPVSVADEVIANGFAVDADADGADALVETLVSAAKVGLLEKIMRKVGKRLQPSGAVK
jgi:hypothetical protein